MPLLRLTVPSAVVLSIASACGGSAFTSSEQSGGSSGASGATASGGEVADGGSKASGGARSSGGSSSSGGMTGFGGTATSGGSSGRGGASTGGSHSGGVVSTGGSNSGGVRASGGASHSGGSSGQKSFDACSASSQCTLVEASCCGACEPSELSDYVAINSARRTEYLASRPCLDVLCSPCPVSAPETTTRGNFGARCVSGRCQAFDVRTSELSLCERASDCALRVGMACCEGCTGGLAAVSTKVDLQAALCGDNSGSGGPIACPACAPLLPENASASCDASLHCAVTWSSD